MAKSRPRKVYFAKRMQNHHGGMIVVNGYLYGANGGNEGGWLLCLDFKTGKIMWDQRDGGQRKAPKGSIAMADGLFYYRTEAGTMLLIEPSPKKYIERGRFEQPNRTDKPAWAHPVIANGKLYVRDQGVLLCYDVKGKGSRQQSVTVHATQRFRAPAGRASRSERQVLVGRCR